MSAVSNIAVLQSLLVLYPPIVPLLPGMVNPLLSIVPPLLWKSKPDIAIVPFTQFINKGTIAR